ncbi:hypothetical protein EV44_g3456 [Erysiphe necator]|uniref:Uncharacterized protein n=1 Tax=Uncinula necator TaxID=52586 RepID=A0A0B1PDS0_UNCNE|nr:hypothetical protein EV44_g3456 [Erysiphe necator]
MANDKISTVTLDPIADKDISNEIPDLITSEKISNKNMDQSNITVENNMSNNSTFYPIIKNTNNHDVSSNSSKPQEKSSVTALPHIYDDASRNESNQEVLETGEIQKLGIKKAVNFDELTKMIPHGSLRSGTKR